MRIEFHQGVPEGCTEWLYKRERVYPQGHEAFNPRDLGPKYVPTITVKDSKLGTLFALRWS